MAENTVSDRVLSLKNDYLFKAVYGSDNADSKFILMSLLNKILNKVENPIIGIELVNPFQQKSYLDEKETILDIKATTNQGEIIDIEMQIVWQQDMAERLIYYHSGLIREALKEGESYSRIKSAITICITDSIAFPNTDEYISEFYFKEEDKNFKLTEITRICCIELPKVHLQHKALDELSPLEICLEYLRCADENRSEYVEELIRRGGKELEMAQEKMTKFTENDTLREQALAREKYQRDMISWKYHLAEADKKIAEADKKIAEADKKIADADKKSAAAKSRLEDVARMLKTDGYPNDRIAEMLQIPVDEVMEF